MPALHKTVAVGSERKKGIMLIKSKQKALKSGGSSFWEGCFRSYNSINHLLLKKKRKEKKSAALFKKAPKKFHFIGHTIIMLRCSVHILTHRLKPHFIFPLIKWQWYWTRPKKRKKRKDKSASSRWLRQEDKKTLNRKLCLTVKLLQRHNRHTYFDLLLSTWVRSSTKEIAMVDPYFTTNPLDVFSVI